MEGLQNFIRKISQDPKIAGASSSSSSPSSYFCNNGGVGVSAALNSSDQSRVLITRTPRQVVSLWTCSKLCTIFFVAGVVVGYSLKRRVRRWASKFLRRLKDD